MLFSFFDPINYTAATVNKNASSVQLTDIFRNYHSYFKAVAARYKLKTYFINGSPRPEELANTLYGNSQLYWVLLMCNNNYDPFYGWMTGQEASYAAAVQKYQYVGGDQVLYHIDSKGEIFYNLVEDPNNPGTWYDKGDTAMKYPQFNGALGAVDIYDDAARKAEIQRAIKIIDPNDIESFITALIREMDKDV